jgi:DNA-binding transcriptional MerR regulator
MALNKDKNLKVYYSIKEVADEIGVNETTLRYWESVFTQISPRKGANGVRQYTAEDIRKVRLVYHLVKEKGLTLSGAKQYLKGESKRLSAETNSEVVETLKNIREELLGIKAALELL